MPETKALRSIVTHESSLVVVDSDTGEVVDSSCEKTVRYTTGASYLKMFYRNLMLRRPMPHAARTLLSAMASSVSHGSAQSGYVFLEGKNREEIKSDYGLCESTLKSSLQWLVKNDYVRRKGKGVYQVNPHLYARGQSSTVFKRQQEWDDDAPDQESPS